MNYLEKTKLKDTMINKGVLQEVNRVFFHPLGLALAVIYFEDCEKTELKLLEVPSDFVYDFIDRFKMDMFKEYANEKFNCREDKIGFIIQTRDSIEQEPNPKIKTIKSERLDILLRHASKFFYEIQHKFIKHHNATDTDNVFATKEVATMMLESAMAENDWVSVAAWAMILNSYDGINKEISGLGENDVKA